ncbi:MAG: acetate--CoA ligase family protein [Alphaproteobacteria bacterium]
MNVVARVWFGGRSCFADRPAAMLGVDFGNAVARGAVSLPEAACARLAGEVPEVAAALAEARRRDIDPASLLARLARDLLRGAFHDSDEAAARRSGGAVRYCVVACADRLVGLAAVDAGFDLVRFLLGDARAPAPAATREAFLGKAERFQLDYTTRLMLRVTEARGIPWHRLSLQAILVQLGQGCRQRRIVSTISGRLDLAARWIAGDKALGTELMARAGVPVARQLRVDSAARAVEAAELIGYPVVLKAAKVDKGKGVVLDLRTRDAVVAAWEKMAHHGGIVVEEQVPGDDHRLFVVDHKLVAAARRLSARVTGDGVSTVTELIAAVNRDPRRGDSRTSPYLVRIDIDGEVRRFLTAQGLDTDSVPERGRTVILRRAANVSMGATSEDVTGIMHPDYHAMATAASRAVGLDFAGIDLLSTDISRPIAETGAKVCEINHSPGVRPHILDPASPDVLDSLIASLLPDGDGRIPMAAITGTTGTAEVVRLAGAIMRAAGFVTGVASAAGAAVDGRQLLAGDAAGPDGVRSLVEDPTVEAAILETAPAGIWSQGLGFDRATVGAVLDGGSDVEGIPGRGFVARTLRLVVEAASGTAVLDADDPACVVMRPHSGAARACWVSPDPANPLLGAGRAAGDIAVTVVAGTIVVRVGMLDAPVVRAAAVRDVRAALFATAIAWGLGAPAAAIAQGLRGA